MFDFFSMAFDNQIIFKIFFAFVLGGFIGGEREIEHKAAGLRTHILVAMGSSAVVAVGASAFGVNDSLARVAAGVVTGVGFLGAGQIITTHGQVHGLTTAASIWASALLGVVVGLGYYIEAFVLSLLIVLTFSLKKLE